MKKLISCLIIGIFIVSMGLCSFAANECPKCGSDMTVETGMILARYTTEYTNTHSGCTYDKNSKHVYRRVYENSTKISCPNCTHFERYYGEENVDGRNCFSPM